MSDAPDKDSKTEQPTEKKISDALEKGNVALSREATLFASLAAILCAFVFLTTRPTLELTRMLQLFLDHPSAFSLETGGDAVLLFQAIYTEVAKLALPIVLLIAGASIAAGFAQAAPRLVLDRIKPKWSRVSPASNLKRIFGLDGVLEFLKSLAKFAIVGTVCVVLLESERRAALNVMFSDPGEIPGLILTLLVKLVSAVAVAAILLVVGDLVRARLRWWSDLRMTRQELKDELRQSEGDPLVKARLRSLARDRARRRMINAVPKATVVIANPTHYAIALYYRREEGGAPKVLAKGTDLLALRIREVAARHSVPVIEDRALARAMYDVVEVDKFIPAEFYRAVAKILFYLYSRSAHASR